MDYDEPKPLPYSSTHPPNDTPLLTKEPDHTIPAAPARIHKRGGWKAILFLLDALILGGAAAFSFYTQSNPIIFNVPSLSGRVVNSSNLSALITGVGSALAAVYAYSMVIIGRLWLLDQLKKKKQVGLDVWQAVASRGSYMDIPAGLHIGGYAFIVALAITWIIPTALSGALVPTLKEYTETLTTPEYYVPIAGNTIGLGIRLEDTDSCFGEGTYCAGRDFFPDIELAMEMTRRDWGSYSSSWGIFSNSTDPKNCQVGLLTIWAKVLRSKLYDFNAFRSASGCVPVIVPTVLCSIVTEDIPVSDGRASYPTGCGTVTVGAVGRVNGSYAYAGECQNNSTGKYELAYTLIQNNGSRYRQLSCQISAKEEYHRLEYIGGSDQYFIDHGPVSCINSSVSLSLSELTSIASSVTWTLAVAAGSSNVPGTTRSPIADGLASSISSTDTQSLPARLYNLNLMIKSGIITTATILYEFKQSNYNATALATADVTYSAYTWSGGFKGYVWSSLLLFASLFGITVACIALTRPRLAYDPTNFSQTVLMASGHSGSRKDEKLKMTLEESRDGLGLTVW